MRKPPALLRRSPASWDTLPRVASASDLVHAERAAHRAVEHHRESFMTSLARASVRLKTGEFLRSLVRLLALGLLAACGGGGDGITVNANVAGVRFVTQPGTVT